MLKHVTKKEDKVPQNVWTLVKFLKNFGLATLATLVT